MLLILSKEWQESATSLNWADFVIIHQRNALKQRIESYSFVQLCFGVLTNFDSMSIEDIKAAIEKLVNIFPKDYSSELYSKFCQFICWYKEQ